MIKTTSQWLAYNSSCFVIVLIYEVSHVSAPFTGIHKLSAEHPAKVNIVATASPVPVWPAWSPSPVIAGA